MGFLDTLKKSKFYQWVENRLNQHSDGIAKFIALAVIWILALIPTWIALCLYWFISPVLMWEVLVTVGLLLFFFGGVQLGIGFLAFILSVKLLVDDF